MEKIIVTGATGFIGRHAIKMLQNKGFDVHAITSKDIPKCLDNDIKWHSVDLFDYAKVTTFCGQVAANNLLHLAWYDDHKLRMTSPVNIDWVEASLHLVRRFAENGGQRIVLAGSCAEYNWQYGYCNEALTPTGNSSIYGVCKASLNKVVEKYCQEKGIQYSCGRFFSMYGPYESEDRLIPYVIKNLLRGQQARLKHANQIRDYLYITDVADALVTLLKSEAKGSVNIGSGQPKKLREIVAMVGKKLNREELIIYQNKNSTQSQYSVVFADISLLRDKLGWMPKYDLETGIDKTIDWWKAQLKMKTKQF
ncbi:NAD(P)-dependent oxidoreductase [Fodinibius sp. Rm-B-1B1-1]|uniref:NAD-dependent epimerase/dehydratase family protein n=1 Tax=Fodinibius alkaliphilus TaxID=3140241 RepID=UPI00315A3309